MVRGITIWDKEDALALLEGRREKWRSEGKRLAFDCLNLRTDGERCRCSQGKRLSLAKDGSVDVRLILVGITPAICLECPEFNPDIEYGKGY